MTSKTVIWAAIAVCLLGWWSAPLNRGLRFIAILSLLGYTGVAALRALCGTASKGDVAIYGAGSIGLISAPSWLIPIAALPVLTLTVIVLYASVTNLLHFVWPGLTTGETEQDETGDYRRYQPADTGPVSPDQPSGESARRHLEPDLDTDSLRFDTKR